MTNSKDRLIIYWLTILTMLTLFSCLMLDKDVDAVNKTVNYLLEQQKATESKIDALIATQAVTDKKLTDIEAQERDISESIAASNDRIDSIQTQVSQHDEAIKAIPTPKAVEVSTKKPKKTNLTEKEIRMIAALVYLEAGDRSTACQRAVASVVINRMNKYHMSARQTVYQSGVFSVAYKVARTTPSKKSIEAVRFVCKNGVTIPSGVTAFRNRHFHSFGRRYKCIDGVYFSYA